MADKVQFLNFEEIIRIQRNYKKDSESRYKTSYFLTRIRLLNEAWEKCTTEHSDVYHAKTHEQKELKEYMAKYEQIYEIFLELLDDFENRLAEFQRMETAAAQPVAPVQVVQQGSAQMQLERVKIPTFSGNYIEWRTFYDLFMTMVHKNAQFSDAQRMQHLKTHLSGDPARLINNLQVSDANYIAALKLLSDRYDNKRAILSALMTTLFEIPASTKESAKELQQMLDIMNDVLSSVTGLGIPNADWDPLVIHILTLKMDTSTAQHWERYLGGSTDVPTLTQFREFVLIPHAGSHGM